MRVACKPEEAEIATKEGIEWRRTAAPWPITLWVSDGMPRMSTVQLMKLGATFEKELPEVGDGKEYEYKRGDGSKRQLPDGTRTWDAVRWSEPFNYWAETKDHIYAIPLKKSSCVVEGVVRDRFDVVPNHIICEGIPADTEVYVLPKEGTVRSSDISAIRTLLALYEQSGAQAEVLVREAQQ